MDPTISQTGVKPPENIHNISCTPDPKLNQTTIFEFNSDAHPAIRDQFGSDLEIMKNVPILSGMDHEKLSNLRAIMDSCHFRNGEIIRDEMCNDDRFHLISGGKVEFLASDGHGGEFVIAEAQTGGFFGELSLLSDEPCTIRVRAKGDVTTLALDRNEFQDFIHENSQAALDIMGVLAERLSHTDRLLRESVSKDVNELSDKNLTFGQRLADRIAKVVGSWPFIITQSTILLTWAVLNTLPGLPHWDPAPFIGMNLLLSLQAAFAAPMIVQSQNRQGGKDRLTAEIDHQVNVKAEIGVATILKRLDNIERNVAEIKQIKVRS